MTDKEKLKDEQDLEFAILDALVGLGATSWKDKINTGTLYNDVYAKKRVSTKVFNAACREIGRAGLISIDNSSVCIMRAGKDHYECRQGEIDDLKEESEQQQENSSNG